MRPISQLRRQKILDIIKDGATSDYKNLLFFHGLNELRIDESFFHEVQATIEKYPHSSIEELYQQLSNIFSHSDCPVGISVRNIEYVDAQKMVSFNEEQMKRVVQEIINLDDHKKYLKNILENLCEAIDIAEKQGKPFSDELIEQLANKIIEFYEQREGRIHFVHHIIDKVSPEQFKRLIQLKNVNKEDLIQEIITKKNERMKENFETIKELLKSSDKHIKNLIYASPYCSKRMITNLLKKLATTHEINSTNENATDFLEKVFCLSKNPDLTKEQIDVMTESLVKIFDDLNKKEKFFKTPSVEIIEQTTFVKRALFNLMTSPFFDEKRFIESLHKMKYKENSYRRFIESSIRKYKDITDPNGHPSKKFFDFAIDSILGFPNEPLLIQDSDQWVINHPFLDIQRKKQLLYKIIELMNEDMFKGLDRHQVEFLLDKSTSLSIKELFYSNIKDADEYYLLGPKVRSILKHVELEREEIEPIFSAFIKLTQKSEQAIRKNESKMAQSVFELWQSLYQQKKLTDQQRMKLLEYLEENMKSNQGFIRKNYEHRPLDEIKNFFSSLVEHSDTKLKIFLLSNKAKESSLDDQLYRPMTEFIKMLILENEMLPNILRKQFDKEFSVDYHQQSPSFS